MRQKALLLIIILLATCVLSCAHDPFLYAPMIPEVASPPAYFNANLPTCIDAGLKQTDAQLFSSPWRFPCYPDLQHRICRGDPGSQERFLQGLREIWKRKDSQKLRWTYERVIPDCSSKSFCAWSRQIAMNIREDVETRIFFFNMLRKNCDPDITVEMFALPDAPSEKENERYQRSYSTTELSCKDIERHIDPWTDLEYLNEAGCLNMVDWLKQHRDDPEGTRSALKRCILEQTIRYEEANCLQALTVIDRQQAVSLVSQDPRRSYGIVSRLDSIARMLLRFPEPGQLESELGRLGLIPEVPVPVEQGKLPPVLPEEILEAYGRLLRFNPECSLRYCEHAPLLYQLADLAAPELDNVIFEERWPALEQVYFGSGPSKVTTTMRAIPMTFNVREKDGSFDKEHFEELKNGVEEALSRSHLINVYVDGNVYRLHIRNLGEWYDLESLIGGLNHLLTTHGSSKRFVTLQRYCRPCADVLAGPKDGLIRASFGGLIEIIDPFKNIWTEPGFNPRLLDQNRKQ